MARISGVDLPENKRIEIALTYIYGIGKATSSQILDDLKLDKNKTVKDLSENEVKAIRDVIQSKVVEGDLRRIVAMNIKRLMDIGNYRGLRHRKGLPVRGQRTKTNAHTRKGMGKISVSRKK